MDHTFDIFGLKARVDLICYHLNILLKRDVILNFFRTFNLF